jgi:hypothetical protein
VGVVHTKPEKDPNMNYLVLLTATLSASTSHRSDNFSVEGPTPAIAQQVIQRAEQLRMDVAVAWLGKEMAPWQTPCYLEVKVTTGAPAGGSSVDFDQVGRVSKQRIWVEGPMDRILGSILPHELTHVIFAHYFGRQPPRWADEGGAILGESKYIRALHDQNLWQALDKPGQCQPFQRFFGSTHYPATDVKLFYAQSASVTRFLVDRVDRPTFLAFVAQGMREGWDQAARTHYRFRSLEEMELAWLRHQRSEALARK